jgi:protein arginine N-methyltransferase 1
MHNPAMSETLDEHYDYLADRVKLERYQAAITRLVRPGHIVMDLGCGSGVLGLMALRAGAGKVLFVDESAIIEVARQTIARAGFAERAEFFHVSSFELDLPQRADIVVCDHVGYFGFDYSILTLLADARQRFLKPRGVMVPGAVDLALAPVEVEKGRDLVARWRNGSVPDDFAWVRTSAANCKHAVEATPENLLAGPATLTTFESGTGAADFLSWQADFACTRSGTLDGLLGWFDARLCDDVRMTNSPIAADRLQRPQAFLPLDEPVSVREGEPVHTVVMARHADHILAWTVELPEQGRRFSLTSFNGLLLDDEALNRSRPDRIARLNERGRAHQVALSYCDGTRTVAEVEALVRKEHPDLFPSAHATEKLVRSVLTWDTGE